MTKNVEIGKYTVKPQCAGECALEIQCQSSHGRAVIGEQILKAVEQDDIRLLPTEVLIGKKLGKRPVEGKVCLHLGRLIGATLPADDSAESIERAEQALEWAVERGFGYPASINQARG